MTEAKSLTPADLLDLALCEGYEFIKDIDDVDTGDYDTPVEGKWVPVELPVYGCQTEYEAAMSSHASMWATHLLNVALSTIDEELQNKPTKSGLTGFPWVKI